MLRYRRAASAIVLGAMLVAGSAGSALGGTLDQFQEVHDVVPGVDASGSLLAQTFTAGRSGWLDTVSIWVESGSAASVRLYETSGGTLVGPAIATGSLVSGTPPNWVSYSFPANSVSAGTQYAIAIDPSTGGFVAGAQSPGSYAGGAASGSGVSGDVDLAFRTFVTSGTSNAPDPEFTLTKGVGQAEAGPFASSLTAPVGSTVWYQLVLTNRDPNGFVGLTLVDSGAGGTFPAACPAIPSPFAAGSTYTCTYSATVTPGTTENTAVAKFGPTQRRASATVTAVGAIATPSPSFAPTPVPTPVASVGAGSAAPTAPDTDTPSRAARGGTTAPVLPAIGLLAFVSSLVALAVRRRPTPR